MSTSSYQNFHLEYMHASIHTHVYMRKMGIIRHRRVSSYDIHKIPSLRPSVNSMVGPFLLIYIPLNIDAENLVGFILFGCESVH